MQASLFNLDPTPGMPLTTGSFPEPRPFQLRAHEALRAGAKEHKNQIIMAPTGAGKCLGFDTPVMMADGTIKPVQDVVVGDRLLGPDGKARNVMSTTRGQEMLYRVIPTKGMTYVVNASHILSLKKTPGSDGLHLADGTVVNTNANIVNVNVETFAASNKTARHCLKGWRASALEFDDVKKHPLFLDPYFLGAWLGDGNQDMPALSSPPCGMVDEWKRIAEEHGYEIVTIQRRETDCPVWSIVGRKRDKRGHAFNQFSLFLDHYGLRERKHVPHEYKTASVQDRLRVIAGMIDSDGHLSNNGFDWISKYKELAEDFAFLCRSVGLAAYISPCKKGIKSIGFVGDYWRVSVSGNTHIVPCIDKRADPRKQKKRALVHGIRIEPLGVGPYYGFEIDGDHLFLLGDFTVTHNTYLGLQICNEAMKRDKRAMFICDRRTLIEQTAEVAARYGLRDYGIIMADHPLYDPTAPLQIASVQTLARRTWPEVDVIIIDEAHAMYESWVKHALTTEARVIGLSATPFSKGLGKVFTNLVNAATMHELTESGVLVPMRVLSGKKIDMKGAKTVGGEWSDGEAAKRGMEIIGDVVVEWTKYADDAKTIVFGATIAHCEEIARQFNAAGIGARVFTANTHEDERKEILNEYRKPNSQIRVLVSVEALAKGFDVPDVGCVCDCRPLRKSLSVAIQMWGRGLRASKDTGKTECKLLDFSGNIIRFLDDYTDIFFNGLDSLDAGNKLDKSIRKDDEEKSAPTCPQCCYSPCGKKCTQCGFERKTRSMVEHEAGELTEIVVGGKTLAKDPTDLWGQIAAYVRDRGRPEKREARARVLFKEITGDWPSRKLSLDSAPQVEITRHTANKLRSLQIAYAKRPR